MRRLTVYLAICGQIGMFALKTLLSELAIPANIQVVGSSSDYETCLRDVDKLEPELVFLDRELEQEGRKLTGSELLERHPGTYLVFLETDPEQCGHRRNCILKSELNRERLAELLRVYLRERFGKRTASDFYVSMIAVKPAGEEVGGRDAGEALRRRLEEKGYRCFRERQAGEFLIFSAACRERQAFRGELRCLMEWAESGTLGARLFISEPLVWESGMKARAEHFEDVVRNHAFYRTEQAVYLELEAEKRRLSGYYKREEFPMRYYARLLEQSRFRQAVSVLQWYLDKAAEQQHDCDLLKLAIFEAGVRLFKHRGLEPAAICDMKRRIMTAESHESLKRLCMEWEAKEEEACKGSGLEPVLQYIKDHYFESLTLADLAKLFHYDYYYLSSAFFKYTGCTFTEYLNLVRIEEACRILEVSEISVSAAADMAGYGSPEYFSRIFKKYKGCSPTAYRQAAGRAERT